MLFARFVSLFTCVHVSYVAMAEFILTRAAIFLFYMSERRFSTNLLPRYIYNLLAVNVIIKLNDETGSQDGALGEEL